MAKIELNGITKQFPDGTIAISNASFTINDGEFFILIGPSGCGKSTLLNMIVGLEEISSGEIRLDDAVINNLDPKDRNMAMVFQSYALYPHMTVRENIAFPLVMGKVCRHEIDKRVAETAAMLKLGRLLDSKPHSLSGGQRQRVAMGRAIVRKPVAFLLDEPLSNLDARLRDEMRIEIARLQRQLGTTTVYVTHDQTEAMTLGDRIAVLNDGIIQQIGTPCELYEQPRNLFVAGFIGSPAMNFFPVSIRNGQLFFSSLNFAMDLPQQVQLPDHVSNAIAGMRPEHLQLLPDAAQRHTKQIVFETAVDVVEWLGAHLLVHFQMVIDPRSSLPALQQNERSDATALLNTAQPIKSGDRIKLTLDPHQLHLFDPRTGNRL